MPRREYGACFGLDCTDDKDDDSADVGYSRLDNCNDNVTLVNNSSNSSSSNRRHERGNGNGDNDDDGENDYFKSVDSYQWNPADADQGQRPGDTTSSDRPVDQGSYTYSGVHVEASKNKRKNSKRRGFRGQLRHVFHSSWKWFKRGFLVIAPTVTAGMTFTPASAYVISSNARRLAAKGDSKKAVYL